MARYKQLKTRYLLLHRYMCAIAVCCIIITIIGGWLGETPASWNAFWAMLVAFSVMTMEYFIMKIWSCWDDAQQRESGDKKARN